MIAYSDHTDLQLFSLIGQGTEAAFRALFYRYNTRVYYFILHIVKLESHAEELTQDVFLKLWTTKANLASVTHPSHYLFIMARNRALDRLDSLSAQQSLHTRLSQHLPRETNDTEEEVLFRESRERIAHMALRLPEQQRRIFLLSKEEGLSRHQIASLMNLSPHTVKNHLSSALQYIRRSLRESE